ncbi:hypothetical protein CF319_g2253 [Tilletia indica]|nr:hypothetical protein CF319_g2253 [Tilletia indica]
MNGEDDFIPFFSGRGRGRGRGGGGGGGGGSRGGRGRGGGNNDAGRGRGQGRGRGRGRGGGIGNSGGGGGGSTGGNFAGDSRGGRGGRGHAFSGPGRVLQSGSNDSGAPNPHGRRAMGFNYAALQGRRADGMSGPGYTPLTATDVASASRGNHQQRSATRGRGAYSTPQQQFQPPRGPRAHERIIEGEDLQIGRTTTFRFSDKNNASGSGKGYGNGVLSAFGRKANRNTNSLAAQPLVFIPATGDWINGAFVPFKAGADIKHLLGKENVDDKDRDKTDLERPTSPETELLKAEAARPPGAGLGYGRDKAQHGADRIAATRSAANDNIDEEDNADEAPAQSRVEREQEELAMQKRQEAEVLLQELLREYATAPPDGRPSRPSEPSHSNDSGARSGNIDGADHDALPFQMQPPPFQRAEMPRAQPTFASEDDEEIILVAPSTAEPVSDSGSSTTESVASIEEVEVSIHTSVAVVVPESIPTAEPDSTPAVVEPTQDAPMEEASKAEVSVPKAAEKEQAEESDSDEEATEFDLSAMQSFVRSMDGQAGGRAMDMLDIAVEARIQAEEEWLTDETDDEEEDESSAPSDAPQARGRAGDEQRGEEDEDDEEDDSASEGSSAFVGSLASERSSDVAAEALGRQRLIEQTKRREGKRNAGAAATGTPKKSAKPALVMDEDEEEYDEDGIEVHWGDTDDEDEDGEDSEDDDDSEEEDDEDEDENEEDDEDEEDNGDFVTFGKGSSSRNFSWKKSDEDFLRQLEIFADEDEGKLTRKERRHRDRLYKAIEQGDIFLGNDLMEVDGGGSEKLSRDAIKRQKGKMRHVGDEDIWAAALQDQWNKDRMKKATKKAQRQAEREALANSPFVASHGINLSVGKLGKKAAKAARRAEKRADRSSRKESAALGLDEDDDDEPAFAYKSTSAAFRAEDHALGNRFANNLVELNEQILLFVRDTGKTTLSLPPMEKRARARVHELANAYNLVSKSTGTGNNRYSILTKGKASAALRGINQRKVNWIVNGALSGGSFGLRPKGAGGKGKGRDGPGGAGRGAPAHASKNQEGAQVGFGAEKIGEENVGHKLLKIMGWSEGTGIGIIEGGAEPIAATVKTRKGGLGF